VRESASDSKRIPDRDVALEKLESMAASKNVPVREFTVSGRPAWEEKEWPRGGSMIFERYVCGRFLLAAYNDRQQRRPAATSFIAKHMMF